MNTEMIRFTTLTYLVLLAFLPCARLLAQTEESKNESTIENTQKAWMERAESFGSAKLMLESTETHQKPFLINDDGDVQKLKGPRTRTLHFNLAIEKEKLRSEQIGNPNYGDDRSYSIINVFDGKNNVSFCPISDANADFPKAWISHGDSSAIGGGFLQPAFICFASDVRLSTQFDHTKLVLEDAEGMIDGELRALFSVDGMDKDVKFWIWVAPEMDYSIVRFDRHVSGRLHSQTNIKYEEDKHGWWVPNAWEYVVVNKNGAVVSTANVHVQSVALNDCTDDDFVTKFPPGCIVMDMRPGPRNTHGSYTYLLREDGERRQITYDERFVDYETIKRTESGTGHLNESTFIRFLRKWGWLALLGIFFAISYRVRCRNYVAGKFN